MIDQTTKLWHTAMAELKRANNDRKHPFRYLVLSTHSEYPESRWVVSRQFTDDYKLLCYTDSRTPKVSQIRENEKVALTYYHPRKKLQIRIKGKATIIQSGPLYEQHRSIVSENPADYSTLLAPGTKLLRDTTHTDELHFALLQIELITFDILLLAREGHTRAQYCRKDEQWQGYLITP